MQVLRHSIRRLAWGLIYIVPFWSAAAVIFTTDTVIDFTNNALDGQDIVVSNCTLTVDGPHTFGGFRMTAGARLTHSANGSGYFPIPATMTNEPYQLIGTDPVQLLNSTLVSASVVVTDTNGVLTYLRDIDYELTSVSGSYYTFARTTNSTIGDGDTVLVTYDYTGNISAGLKLTCTNDFELESGATIDLDGRGFGGNVGSGNGGEGASPLSGGGAGHGGLGGNSSSNAVGGSCYDLFSQPIALGSGGGAGVGGVGGPGGGALRLAVSGAAILMGNITVNGAAATNSRSGGGSGGSVWITAQSVFGTGGITASGGAGEPVHGGGGGGGRIAILAETNAYSGAMVAYGGVGWQIGGAGTVYSKIGAEVGQVLVDNGGQSGTNTVLSLVDVPDVIIRGKAGVTPVATWIARDIIVESNSVLLVTGPNSLINLSARDLMVHSGAAVLADRAGYSSQQGPGAGGASYSGASYLGSGGGYGGYGGNSSNNVVGGRSYGSVNTPYQAGSGGGGPGITGSSLGGSGGGAIQVTSSRLIQVDGRISANGGNGTSTNGGGSGGGSGGGIWLFGSMLSGGGSITANGGAGAGKLGGGGGGGRIAINFAKHLFAGNITAYGGSGAVGGGAGTLYFRTNNTGTERVLLDNGGAVGTNTPLGGSPIQDLVVLGGAVGEIPIYSSSLQNVWIQTNGALVSAFYSGGGGLVTVSIYGDLTIDAGGTFSLNGLGYTGGSGPAAGTMASPPGGGGHGGYGALNVNFGSGAYGSILSPVTAGSGGGNGSGSSGAGPFGGAGGGALRLVFTGQGKVLTVNGTLSADGLRGQLNSGGGAGGSLWLSPVTLAGSGRITANGGMGNGLAGGGGGGRIFISYNSNQFAGTLAAWGGAGAVVGGAGTVYLQSNRALVGELFLDNGGLAGTNTPLSSAYTMPASRYNLTISGAASALVLTSQQLSNLTVGAGSVLTLRTNETNLTLDVLHDVNIAPGGAISGDGVGYPRGSGLGGGVTVASKGSGGGYGGKGGNSQSGASGGKSYGSATQPVDRGSGGGGGANAYFGGCQGGSALRLLVGGTLNVAGSVTANGTPGWQDDSGGGAGGSIWITAGGLTGVGSISAAGGPGDLFGGGGGGGGRIAIYSPTNLFSGTFSVAGGYGAYPGEAGTVFITTNLNPLIAIMGTVTNLAGQPVAGVWLQPDSPIPGTMSDPTGRYVLGVPSGWTGAVTPVWDTNQFLPSWRGYFSITAPQSRQDFLVVATVSPSVTATAKATNLVLAWPTLPGVMYWAENSTNFVDWSYYAGPFTNGGAGPRLEVPYDPVPSMFFRIRASY